MRARAVFSSAVAAGSGRGEHRRGAVGRLAGAGRRDGRIGVAGAERRAEGRVDGVGADLAEFRDRGVDVVFACRDQLVPARVGEDVEPAGGDDDAEPGRGQPGIDPASDLPPGDLPVPAESAGADRDADPAAVEVQVLGRARIRQAVASPASASVAVGCFPQGEEAGQLLAGHVVQGDREVAVGGRCLRWFGVIVVSRAGGRGTGGGPGVLPGRSGRAGRGRVCGVAAGWSSSGLVRWSGRSASGWCSPAAAAGTVAGLGASCRVAAPLRGGCLRCRASGAGGGGGTGRCRARRAGRRGAGAVLRVRAVLRRVVEQGLLDGAGSRGSRGGRGPARRARAAARPRSRPRRRRRPRSAAALACLSSSSLGAVRPASGWTAAVSRAAEDGAAGVGGGEQPVTQAAGDTRLYPRGDFLPPDEGRGAVIAVAVGDQPVRGGAVPALAGAVVAARDRPAGLAR